jgi:hypothetical protein
VIRRGFWVALGLGAGATFAVIVSRRMRRATEAMAPANIAREARGVLSDLGQLVQETLEEFRKGMAAKEAELRTALDV